MAAPTDRSQPSPAAELEQLRAWVRAAEDRAADLEDFVDNAVEALHKVDADGRIVWANRAELEMLGYAPGEYIGRNIAEFHANPAIAADVLGRLRAGQAIRNRAARLRCKDGSEKVVLISSSGCFRDGGFVGTRCFTRDVTREQQAFMAESRLAAIVESSDDAIIGTDLQGTIASWNPAAERLFQYRAEEVVGTSVLRIVPSERQDEEAGIIARIGAGRRVQHYETVRVRKDGSRVHVSLSASPIRDAFGAIVGVSKMARDITDHREAGRMRGVLASIVESSQDAIVSKDLNGIITSWNAGAQRIFGYSAEEIVGRPVLWLIPPELHDEETRILSSIRAGRRVEHYETQRVAKGGRRIHVSLSVSPILDASGRVVGASKVARDVTAHREADRAKATLAAIVQSSDDAIISTGLDGRVQSWNPAAEQLYGYSADEMIGQSVGRIIPPDLHGDQELVLAKIRSGERVRHHATVRIAKSGRRIPVSISISPLRDGEGRLIGASKIARDITAEREAQQRKDEFVAVLAHELRNPLAPIRTALTLLARDDIDAAQRSRALEIAGRQMTQLTRLLDDLLDVSRLATGKVELRKSTVDLGAIARQAVDAARPVVEANRHTLDVRIAPAPLLADADPVRVAQIVGNLLANAAKYTAPGGRIGLDVEREGDTGVIRVKDTGIGFSPEFGRRLFTLFSQDPATLHLAAGGLGIGLALAREFAERHGGGIEASSPGPALGSVFTVRLPLRP